ncbi:MAG: hypothetical protein ACI8QS_003700, partial [Planctomycetota bacterium]
TNCLARRRVLRVAVPTRVVPTTQPGDLWGPSEELLFFNGLLASRHSTPDVEVVEETVDLRVREKSAAAGVLQHDDNGRVSAVKHNS